MGQGHYDTITYEQVISFVKRNLRIAGTSEHDANIELFINEAVRHLNNLGQLVPKSCVLELSGNTVKIPSGCNAVFGVRFCRVKGETVHVGDDDDDEQNVFLSNKDYQYQPLIYWNYKWFNDCNLDQNDVAGIINVPGYNMEGTYKIVDGYIVFNTSISDDYTHIQIMYESMNEDENGRMTIYARYERAVRNYAVSEMADMYPEMWGHRSAKAHKVWKAQKQWIRGDDQEKHWHKNKFEIQQMLKTMFLDSYQ